MRHVIFGVLILGLSVGGAAGQSNAGKTPTITPATTTRGPAATIGPVTPTPPTPTPGPSATIGPVNPVKIDPAQAALKSDMMLRISQFIYGYKDKQMFYKWMCFGKTDAFRKRLNQPTVSISVSPGLDSMAEYRTGSQTIVLRNPPKKFVYSLGTAGDSSFLLWHETIHAISHGHQVGAIKPAKPFKSAPKNIAPTAGGAVKAIGKAEGMIDHYYINWAESCVGATKFLVRLEKILKANGKTKPTDKVKTLSQKNWKAFVRDCNFSIYGQVPDKKERKELEDMIGFRCDPAEVLNGYLSLGYPMEYFGPYATDTQIWKLFPTGAQVGMAGVKPLKEKTISDNLSVSYVKSWAIKPSGRRLGIHLTLYGSKEINTFVWDAFRKVIRYKSTSVPGVGDTAVLYDRGANNAYHGHAKFWNAGVLIVDMDILMPEKGPISLRRRAINWNLAKRIFINMEAMGFPPVPVGVETSMKKLKAGR